MRLRIPTSTYHKGLGGLVAAWHAAGRWPANIVHDGSEEVVAAFPDAPGQLAAVGPQHGPKGSINVYGDYGHEFSARIPVLPPVSSTPPKPMPMTGSAPSIRPSSRST
jgi:hypothetical protein